ncbi:hypothetical protein ABZ942_18900 [Nocardia sp. NPDC046473]|uniref:DUF6959 family protein n=1 Tax=Nocardia sp. NPDC046473 TaxID=3155733 RepID=UPI0033F54BC7
MERVEVEMLAPRGNVTVIRLPWRRFPGVFIQGDSFSILEAAARAAAQRAPEVRELAGDLTKILALYARTLAEHGMSLPYATAPSQDSTELLASGRIPSSDLRLFLELASSYIGYDFDNSDWTAITSAFPETPALDYPLIGATSLTARVQSADGGAHVTVAITGTPNDALRIRLATLFDVLTHESRRDRDQ